MKLFYDCGKKYAFIGNASYRIFVLEGIMFQGGVSIS